MVSELLQPKEVAAQLGVPVQTIYQWRTKSKGPRAIRVGRHLRFRQEEVDAWLESQSDPRAKGVA